MKKLLLILPLLVSLFSSGQYVYNVSEVTGKTNKQLPYLVTGDYLNDNFQRSSIGSNYTVTNPNATLTFPSSAHLHVTGGNNTFGDHANFTNSSVSFSPDRYKIKLGIVAQSNAATDGIGFAQVSAISVNPAGFFVKIDLATTNIAGIIVYPGAAFTSPLTSISGLTFHTGDSLLLEIVRQGPYFTYRLTNVGTSQVISCNYAYDRTLATTYEPNLATPSLYFFHGTQDVYLLQVTDLNQKNGNAVGMGDSIMEGYKSSGTGNDWLTQLFSGNTNLFDRNAGVSETAADAIGRVAQVIAENPKYVVLCLGVNDITLGVAHATFKANYDTIVTRLQRAGITVIIISLPPLNSFNVTTNYNPDLQAIATARSAQYVDNFTLLANGTALNALYDAGDGIHWNNSGHALTAQNVRYACPQLYTSYSSQALKFNRTPVVPITTVTRISVIDSVGNQAQVAFSPSFLAGGSDKAVQYDSAGALSGNVNAINWDYTLKQLNLPAFHTTEPGAWIGGFSMTPFAADNQIFLSNAYYNGGIKYKTTDFMEGIELTGGVIYIFCAPSGTANAAVTYKNPFQAASDGSVKIGNPTAFGTVFNWNVLPGSLTFATFIVPTGASSDSALVFTNVAGVSTLKAVAQPVSGQTTLVAGTKTITVTGATAASVIQVTLLSPNTATSTVMYQASCTTGSCTIQANLAATTINVADISQVQYTVIKTP